ncbi:MAG TPA: hypothetical protein DHW02_01800 [Ktedonobacter sp.]|nr:hypothetical protein [Ktedonobacter sp.]
MAITQNELAIGVFTNPVQARKAISELQRAGFDQEEIGYLTRATETSAAATDQEDRAATGAFGGGILGGVLGAAASLFIPGIGPAVAGGILAATFGGIVIGALAGGIVGILTGMGVSEEDARFYQRELEAGRTIVTVKNADGAAQAASIMQRCGAYNATTPVADFNAPPTLRPRANEEQLPEDNSNEQSL